MEMWILLLLGLILVSAGVAATVVVSLVLAHKKKNDSDGKQPVYKVGQWHKASGEFKM